LTIINFVIDRDIEIYKHKDLDKDADIRRDVFLSILAPVFIVILSSLVFFPLEITLFALCAYTALYVAAESIIDEVLEDKLKDKESNNYKYSSDKKLSFFSKQNIGKNNYIDDEHIESGYRNNQT
jgi:hypothetical protein